MDPIKSSPGGFQEIPTGSNGSATQNPTGPVPKSDLAKRVPTLLTFLLSRPMETKWVQLPQTQEQMPSYTPPFTGNGSAEETGVQQLIQGFQNLNTGSRMRTIRKTIRRDRKIISSRPHNNYSFSFIPSIENNGLERRTSANFGRDRRFASRFHRIGTVFSSFGRGNIGHKPILDSTEHANLANNNNMVYTPSLMDIPEYPENVIPNSYYATQEVTETTMEK